MKTKETANYKAIRDGALGYCALPRGLFEVNGAEAPKFLNGLVTNDVEKMEAGEEFMAAIPTGKGRIFAIVRIRRSEDCFYIETEAATREKVYEKLNMFTYAGEFTINDLSDEFEFFRIYGVLESTPSGTIKFANDVFVSLKESSAFRELIGGAIEIDTVLYDVLRIEDGEPIYGIDMNEEIVVPEINIDGLISYEKGCYIGQEVIARIHFRGRVAKEFRKIELKGFSDFGVLESNLDKNENEIIAEDGKIGGFVTSLIQQPGSEKVFALGYVRSRYLDDVPVLKFHDALVKLRA